MASFSYSSCCNWLFCADLLSSSCLRLFKPSLALPTSSNNTSFSLRSSSAEALSSSQSLNLSSHFCLKEERAWASALVWCNLAYNSTMLWLELVTWAYKLSMTLSFVCSCWASESKCSWYSAIYCPMFLRSYSIIRMLSYRDLLVARRCSVVILSASSALVSSLLWQAIYDAFARFMP